MWEDPIVSEVRCIREDLAARFDFDVDAIFADFRQKQKALRSRLVRREREDDDKQMAAPDQDFAAYHPGR